MGFGGAASSMITSLKNNKRVKSTTFKKMKEFKKVKYSDVHFNKKATPQQLKKIREKLKLENKKNLLRKVILFAIFFCILIYFIKFYKY